MITSRWFRPEVPDNEQQLHTVYHATLARTDDFRDFREAVSASPAEDILGIAYM